VIYVGDGEGSATNAAMALAGAAILIALIAYVSPSMYVAFTKIVHDVNATGALDINGALDVNGDFNNAVGGHNLSTTDVNSLTLHVNPNDVNGFEVNGEGATAWNFLNVIRDGKNGAQFNLTKFHNTANQAANILQRRARGTFAVPLPVEIGDVISNFGNQGWTGSMWSLGASLRTVLDGPVTSNRAPMSFEFRVRKYGGLLTAMTIDSNNWVSIEHFLRLIDGNLLFQDHVAGDGSFIGFTMRNTDSGGGSGPGSISEDLIFDLHSVSREIHFDGAAGNIRLGNWFDQSVKTTASPAFVNVTADSNVNYGGRLIDENLNGFWQFDNNQAIDSSIYDNDGTFVGAAHAEKDIAEFNGVDAGVNMGNPTELQITGKLTISVWIQLNELGRNQLVVAKDDTAGGGNRNYSLWIPSNNLAYFTVYKSNVARNAISGTPLELNKWYHIVGVHDGVTNSVWVNGIEQATTGSAVGDIDNDPNDFLLGNNTANFFNGKLDNVRVYNRQLSQEEINQLYEKENKRQGYFNELHVRDLNVSGTATFGNDTNFSSIDENGVAFITVSHGSMFQHNTGIVITISAAGVPVDINAMSFGAVNGFHSGGTDNNALVCLVAGLYKVDWSVSFGGAAANQNFESGVSVNGAIQENTTAHRKVGTANDIGNMGGTGIVDLAVNDLVSVFILNQDGTNDATIDHVNLALIRIG